MSSKQPSARGHERQGSDRVTRGTLILAGLVAACLTWLVAGLAIHLNSVAPTQRLVLSEQARTLAKELDAAVKMRAAVVVSAVHSRQLENVLATSGLDNLVDSIRSQFPDFMSLELLNVNGEVLAMVGDVPLGETDLTPKNAGENVFRIDPRASNTGVFRDDPSNGCFFLTSRHKDSDGTYWYTRTRFTRNAIEGLFNEFQGRATLVSIAVGKQNLEQVYGHPARTYGSWWSGPEASEATLEIPGWLVKVAAEGKGSLLRRTSIIFPFVILVLAGLAWLFRPRIPLQEDYAASSRGADLVETRGSVPEFLMASASPKQVVVEEDASEPQSCEKGVQQHASWQNESASADVSTAYHPPAEFPSIENESPPDYVCPPQLIFDPMGEAWGSSAEENPALGPVAVELEDVAEPGSDDIWFVPAEDVVISEERDELSAEPLPDVLELEWEEPPAEPASEPKKEAPRETVRFYEFFNC